MAEQVKRKARKLGKIIGSTLFILIIFTNIKIALLDDTEIANSDISILGIKINLFEATYATETGDSEACAALGCSSGPTYCGTYYKISTNRRYNCYMP